MQVQAVVRGDGGRKPSRLICAFRLAVAGRLSSSRGWVWSVTHVTDMGDGGMTPPRPTPSPERTGNMEWMLYAVCIVGWCLFALAVLALCQTAGDADEHIDEYLEYLEGPLDPRD